MKFSTAIVAVLSTAGVALAQGVTSAISPAASAPAGCSASYDGSFEITVAKVEGAQKRDGPIAVSCLPKFHQLVFVSPSAFHVWFSSECRWWRPINDETPSLPSPLPPKKRNTRYPLR